MQSLNVIALFCEDIREETQGAFTIVGALPDNLEFVEAASTSPADSAFAKPLLRISIYVRVNFDPEAPPSAGVISLGLPNGQKMPLKEIDAETIQLAAANAKKKGSILTGVITRVGFGHFPLSNGLFTVEVALGDDTYRAGVLNVSLPTSPPSAQQQPS